MSSLVSLVAPPSKLGLWPFRRWSRTEIPNLQVIGFGLDRHRLEFSAEGINSLGLWRVCISSRGLAMGCGASTEGDAPVPKQCKRPGTPAVEAGG